jgi:hypothetical protein
MAQKRIKKIAAGLTKGMDYYEKNRERINENVDYATNSLRSGAQKIQATRQAIANAKAKIPVRKKKMAPPQMQAATAMPVQKRQRQY